MLCWALAMTLATVPTHCRASLAPLYEGFVGLHGMLHSILEGVLGTAYADDAGAPRVARLALDDFHCIAGDPDAPAAIEALRAIPPEDHAAIPEAWRERLLATRQARPYDRFAFQAPAQWDRAQLTALREGLPGGFALSRVTSETVATFRGLAESLVANFGSDDQFLARGVGFAVTAEASGRVVAGCSSYAISSRSLEFEIQTHPDYRRRGLALVTGATMIEHCLDAGLEPCWDAAHEGSAVLAERLGFVGRRRYTAYKLL